TFMDCKGLKYLESQEGYQEIHEYYEEMKAEIREVKKRFDEDKEVYDGKKLVFFEFQSPYHINSSIATQISIDKEEWIYVIAKKEDGKVNVSARCQSGRLDLGKTLREALPEEVGEEAEAGGHRNAAGASFSYKFLDRFKEKLLNSIDDFED
ncbi:MAG: DHH family phosphoesterase, partial [Candidatus Nanohaloarchaeota archaeon QJJ-9]|nr:DHH family phosphoesterase [Candidatus Nanohaloarchaeota archaeon QJJ-9]